MGKYCLAGYAGEGQEVLEKALKCLTKSALLNNESAQEYLKGIAIKGITFVPKCGGNITADMIAQIKDIMKQSGMLQNASEEKPVESSQTDMNDEAVKQALTVEYNLLKQQAFQGNPEAMALLGIRLRDGQGVEKSPEESQKYFIEALLKWDYERAKINNNLQIAFAGVVDRAETDLRALVARAKCVVGTSLHTALTKSQSTAYAERADENMQRVLKMITTMHTRLLASNNPEDSKLFYSTSAANLINQLCVKVDDIGFASKISQLNAQRMIACPHEIDDDGLRWILNAPLSLLQDKLEYAVIYEPETVSNFIGDLVRLNQSLRTLIAQNQWCKQQYEYLTALIDINTFFKDKELSLLENLSKNGNEKAAFMQAYLALHGHTLPNQIPENHAKGLSILESLANKGHKESSIMLTELHLIEAEKCRQVKDIEKHLRAAEKYLLLTMKNYPNEHEALFNLGEIYFNNSNFKPSEFKNMKLSSEDRDKYIMDIFTQAKNVDLKLTNRALFYKTILKVRKNDISLSTIQQLESLLFLSEKSDDLNKLLVRQFQKKSFGDLLEEWAEKYINENVSDKAQISRVQSIVGWLYALMVGHFIIKTKSTNDDLQENNDILKKSKAKAKQYLEKSISAPDSNPTAHFLLAGLLSAENDKEKLAEAKKHILQATSIMITKQLKLANVLLAKETLNDYGKIIAMFDPASLDREKSFIELILKKIA